MDNRLIILYYPKAFLREAVTQEDRSSGLMVEPVQASRLGR